MLQESHKSTVEEIHSMLAAPGAVAAEASEPKARSHELPTLYITRRTGTCVPAR